MHNALISRVLDLFREGQGVITLFTFLVGLFAGTYLTRRTDKLRQLELIRTSAYADFLRGIAGLAIMQRHIPRNESELGEGRKNMTLVADAKARIAVYGSDTVVAALAAFLRGGSALDTPERCSAFVDVCRKFRRDSISRKETPSTEDISRLLFDLEPKDFLPND